MTATAIRPNPQESWFVARVLTTPVGVLLRGKVQPRATVVSLLAEAGLPPALSDLVRHVVRRSRLWDSAETEVARELIAHFEDGLFEGASEEELIRSFGDPIQAARLIGRAIRRRHVTRRVMKVVIAVIYTVLVLMSLLVLLASGESESRRPPFTTVPATGYRMRMATIPEMQNASQVRPEVPPAPMRSERAALSSVASDLPFSSMQVIEQQRLPDQTAPRCSVWSEFRPGCMWKEPRWALQLTHSEPLRRKIRKGVTNRCV